MRLPSSRFAAVTALELAGVAGDRARGARARLAVTILAAVLSGCAARPPVVSTSDGHLTRERVTAPGAADILPPVRSSAFVVPPPKPAPKPQTYSVVVTDVPVRELLQALARDTRQNIDIHPGLSGLVSINAINETLPAILDRIAKQVSLRFLVEGSTIHVTPDTPYLKTYRVNYVNLSRDTESRIGVTGEISGTGITGGAGGGSAGSGGGGAGANVSSTSVRSTARNDFWASLQDNIRAILASTRARSQTAEERQRRDEAARSAREERLAQAEAVARAGAGATALFKEAFSNVQTTQPGDVRDDIVVNPISGTISVIGTERQHQLVQQHIDNVVRSAQRQVLIEATIVEVALSDNYQAGIDWTRLANHGGLTLRQRLLGGFGAGLAQSGNNLFEVGYVNTTSRAGNINATLRLLEEFGNTRVLSSPKLMALNNQTALLKVVDNIVYFEVQAQTTTPTQGQPVTTFNTTPRSVSVGVVMGVTPQVNEDGRVTLSVRPTISRVLRFKNDPNPQLTLIQNQVPEIQVREMESVLQIGSGQTVILGGLMQDDARRNREQIPGADMIGSLGELFRFRDERSSKSELVIFLRPTVVANASLDSDELRFFQQFLPSRGQGAPTRDRVGAAP